MLFSYGLPTATFPLVRLLRYRLLPRVRRKRSKAQERIQHTRESLALNKIRLIHLFEYNICCFKERAKASMSHKILLQFFILGGASSRK